MSIDLFRTQCTRLYMCTGTDEGGWSRGKMKTKHFECQIHPSPPFMTVGHLLHLSHLKKSDVRVHFKIIHHFQSVFNRQVLTSRDSMRFFARIKRKKVSIMMTMSIDLLKRVLFSGFAECKLKCYFNVHVFRKIIILERFFNFSCKLCWVPEEAGILAGVLHSLNKSGESGISLFFLFGFIFKWLHNCTEWSHNLSEQRDAEHLKLHEIWWNEGKGEMWVFCF